MGAQRLELDFARGRARRLALGGGTLGFLGLGAWAAFVVVRLLGASGMAANLLLAMLLPVALGISTALGPLLLWMRAPRPARLEWDADAIVERDGHAVRTAIRWRDARARIETRAEGRLVQITDRDGRAITVAEHGATPRWLARRRGSAADLSALLARIADLDAGPPIEPDGRDARRPPAHPSVALLTVAIGAVGVPLLHVVLRPLAVPFAALIACILASLPALRPLHEMLALLAEARTFERAEPATIEEGEGDEALMRRDDERFVRVELGAARHPDALLATRQGARVWMVLPVGGWVPSPSRSAARATVAVASIETDHDRTVRGELLRAAGLELLARGLAVLFWGAASLTPLLH